MSEFPAASFETETLSEQLSVDWLHDAWSFFGGLLLMAVLAVVGAAAVTVALVVGVVGAPIIAAAVAYVIFRNRRATGVRALAT